MKIKGKEEKKEYKSNCSVNHLAKFAEAYCSQLEEAETGTKYESGLAVKRVKTKDAPKPNPEGTLPSEWSTNTTMLITTTERDATTVVHMIVVCTEN